MNGHRRLAVWQRARQLVGTVYGITRALPSEERFVLTPQLRRAAWSVPANIAEGNAKLGMREMRRYFDCALGSLAEVDSFVGILPDIYGVDTKWLEEIEGERKDITRGLIGIIRARSR